MNLYPPLLPPLTPGGSERSCTAFGITCETAQRPVEARHDLPDCVAMGRLSGSQVVDTTVRDNVPMRLFAARKGGESEMRNTPWTAQAQETHADVRMLAQEVVWRDGVCDERERLLLAAIHRTGYRLARADHARREGQHMENMGEPSPALMRCLREIQRDFGPEAA